MIKNLFNILTILLIMTLIMTGCNSQDSSDSESESSSSSKETVEEIESSDGSDTTTTDGGYEFIIEDNDPYESELLGAQVEGNGTELPSGLIGYWTVVEGMPAGLSEYSLNIGSDGYTVQTTVSTDGTTSSYDGYTVATDSGYYITDSSGMTLMSFDYSNGVITTYSLTGGETIFQR